MVTAKVGRRGQLTIPKTIREQLSIQEGDRLAFVIKNGSISIEPLNTTIFDMRGAVSVEEPQDFARIRKRTIDHRVKDRYHQREETSDA